MAQSIHRPAEAEEGAILAKAVVAAARQLGLSNKALAQTIGVSEATVSRMANGAYAPVRGDKPFELAILVVRLFRALDAIVGGDPVVAQSWLRAENTALGGKPIEKLTSIVGLIDVIAYLDARRAVV